MANDVIDVETKSANDRLVMHVLYGLHTLAWFSGGTLAVIALVVNYLRRADEVDALYVEHHTYMIATFWWTLLWLVVLSPLWILVLLLVLSPYWIPFFFLVAITAYGIVWLWCLYRCIKGWMRFNDRRYP